MRRLSTWKYLVKSKQSRRFFFKTMWSSQNIRTLIGLLLNLTWASQARNCHNPVIQKTSDLTHASEFRLCMNNLIFSAYIAWREDPCSKKCMYIVHSTDKRQTSWHSLVYSFLHQMRVCLLCQMTSDMHCRLGK